MSKPSRRPGREAIKLERKKKWGNRKQHFSWVNKIEYYYGDFKKQIVHVIVCEERWEEIENGQVVTKHSRHSWISSKPLNRDNIHERCNLAARHRWNIESEFLVEKCYGYEYKHCFAYDWNVVKGYHYLMRIGRMINVLAQYSECFVKEFRQNGVRGFISFVVETLTGPWLDKDWVKTRLQENYQLRLI